MVGHPAELPEEPEALILPFDTGTKTVRCSIGTLLDLCLLPESLRGGDESIDLQTRLKFHKRAQRTKAAETSGSTEVRVELRTSCGGIRFHISGRADVVSPDGVWEIKTCSPLREIPLKSHQLQLYFYMKALKARQGWLHYVDPDTSGEISLPQQTKELRAIWNRFLREASRLVSDEWRHHEELKERMVDFSFPYDSWRPGQQELSSATRSALESSGESMIQAPTGTGKTAAVLFGAARPAVMSWHTVFFLTAKNTQKRLALETGALFRKAGLPIRVVALASRHDTCPMDTDRCSPETCPLAQVFEERVTGSGLIGKLLSLGVVTTEKLLEMASGAGVCPFEAGLCLAQRCDLIICDYNHVFDPSASLKRFFSLEETASRIDLLIDEAANLPERVMKIWSPEIRASWLRSASGHARGSGNRKLSALIRPWMKFMDSAGGFIPGNARDDHELPSELVPPRADMRRWKRVMGASDRLPLEALELSRAVARFALVAERRDERFHLLGRRENGETVVQWFCSDPSELTREVHSRCGSVTAFSATLSPCSHFRPVLGFGESAEWTGTEWPFPRENLRVWIDSTVDTRWKTRDRSTAMVADRLRGAWRKTPGTWLAWFPSFQWMEEVAALIRECEPLVQPRVTTAAERDDFIALACSGGRVVLTVAGGVFSEGVDLTFPDLRGGFVAGPFLPSVCTRQELVRTRHAAVYGDGFLHAYVIPGMNRVIQAAGRLVRTPDQKADLVLIGRRFIMSPYRELLPAHWFPVRVITREGVRMERGGDRSLPPCSEQDQVTG